MNEAGEQLVWHSMLQMKFRELNQKIEHLERELLVLKEDRERENKREDERDEFLALERMRKKNDEYIRSRRSKYNQARFRAKHRGIEWDISFQEWNAFWTDDYFNDMGPGGFMMCRINEPGPYSSDNVYIGTAEDNQRDRRRNEKENKNDSDSSKLA